MYVCLCVSVYECGKNCIEIARSATGDPSWSEVMRLQFYRLLLTRHVLSFCKGERGRRFENYPTTTLVLTDATDCIAINTL